MELAVGSEAKEETEETAEKRETNRTEFAGWEVPSRSLTKSPSFGRLDGNPKLPRASAAGGRLSVGSSLTITGYPIHPSAMLVSCCDEMNPSRRNTMEDVHVCLRPGTWGAPDPSASFIG